MVLLLGAISSIDLICFRGREAEKKYRNDFDAILRIVLHGGTIPSIYFCFSGRAAEKKNHNEFDANLRTVLI